MERTSDLKKSFSYCLNPRSLSPGSAGGFPRITACQHVPAEARLFTSARLSSRPVPALGQHPRPPDGEALCAHTPAARTTQRTHASAWRRRSVKLMDLLPAVAGSLPLPFPVHVRGARVLGHQTQNQQVLCHKPSADQRGAQGATGGGGALSQRVQDARLRRRGQGALGCSALGPASPRRRWGKPRLSGPKASTPTLLPSTFIGERSSEAAKFTVQVPRLPSPGAEYLHTLLGRGEPALFPKCPPESQGAWPPTCGGDDITR